MNDNLKRSYEIIRQEFKKKFGLPANSPSNEELKKILLIIRKLKPEERTKEKWRELIYKYVRNV